MAGRTATFLTVILLTIVALPLTAQAVNSGGIEASDDTLALVPPTGLKVGDTVMFSLTLKNTLQSEANNVGYAFYRNQISSNTRILEGTVNIADGESKTVYANWSGLLESDQKVWVEFEYPYGSNAKSFFKEFEVAGLPNLRIMQTALSPATNLHSGDTVQLSTLVKNTGSEPAAVSQLHLDLPAPIDDQLMAIESLGPNQEIWLNTTFTAPLTGGYQIYVTPDYYDEVQEASENDKIAIVSFNVEPRMDLYHVGVLTVDPTTGSVDGPWGVTGILGRTGQSGLDNVTMWLEVGNSEETLEYSQPFYVEITGDDDVQQPWSFSLDKSSLNNLQPGSYQITAVIDPFNDGGFTQEDTTNDRHSSNLVILQIPDVLVYPTAQPSLPVVTSGDEVTWGVSVTNTGGEEVRGKLDYTFEGVSGSSPVIVLGAGEEDYWEIPLRTGVGTHYPEFVAVWNPSDGYIDRNLDNNRASNTIKVESGLSLTWAGSSLRILDLSGQPVDLPLKEGDEYVFAINLTSQGLGSLTIDCEEITNIGSEALLATIPANITTIGQKVSIDCKFIAAAPSTTIQFTPSDDTVADPYRRTFSTISIGNDVANAEQSEIGTVALIGIAALILVAILVIAVLLTRETEEAVERDIFEYCPACDGELEGDENRCPHCTFNLAKARKQFHSCIECGESVPDLMENCPYCGSQQDVSSFFERRERRQKKTVVKEIPLPEEEDENIVVAGSANFAETVREFGYDEDQLEDEWDENIASAEAKIAEIQELYDAEISTDGLTLEEIEELESQFVIKLKGLKEMESSSQNLDEMLAAKGELVSHKDDGTELTASDAEIRGRLYEITGEEGVMPGDEVNIGMGLSDSSLAGNEIEEVKSDFTVEDDDPPLAQITHDELQPDRQKPKRRRVEKKTAECGACGAAIPIMAKECSVCGAKFE